MDLKYIAALAALLIVHPVGYGQDGRSNAEAQPGSYAQAEPYMCRVHCGDGRSYQQPCRSNNDPCVSASSSSSESYSGGAPSPAASALAFGAAGALFGSFGGAPGAVAGGAIGALIGFALGKANE